MNDQATGAAVQPPSITPRGRLIDRVRIAMESLAEADMWATPGGIARMAGLRPSSDVPRRIRELRQAKHGGYRVLVRSQPGKVGAYEYRLDLTAPRLSAADDGAPRKRALRPDQVVVKQMLLRLGSGDADYAAERLEFVHRCLRQSKHYDRAAAIQRVIDLLRQVEGDLF